jgi:hypothetical protein
MHEDIMSVSSGRPASPYDPTPLLALHDFLDQKVPTYTHSYSRDMGTLVEEDEEQDSEDEVVISPINNRQELGGNESTTSQPQQQAPDWQKLSRPRLITTPRYKETKVVQTQRANQDHLPQPMSRSKSSPADIPKTSPPRRPNWQTIRYQSVPGRTNKDNLAAWIEGWSEDIGQLGDEAYCACADSTACPREHDTPPALKMKKKKSFRNSTACSEKRDRKNYQVMDEVPNHDSRESSSAGADVRNFVASSTPELPDAGVTLKAKKQVGFAICQNCSRQPSPLVAPGEDFVFSTGPNRIVLRCKVVLKSIFGGRRQLKLNTFGQQPISQWVGEEKMDEDDDEVNLDQLSRSSKGLKRPGEDIAERRARLRRAQKLLRGDTAPVAAGA